jgi:hypothetical protein
MVAPSAAKDAVATVPAAQRIAREAMRATSFMIG